MSSNTLGDLVRKAQGDRTVREYAKMAGVDPSTLTRIKQGNYTPGEKVLKKLVSPQAAPQGNVTLEQLVKAANSSASYKGGLAAGMAVLGMATGGLTGLPAVTTMLSILAGKEVEIKAKALMKEKDEEQKGSNEIERERAMTQYRSLNIETRRFADFALGTIYRELINKSVCFRPSNQGIDGLELYDTDTVLSIEDNEIDSWLFSFATFSKEYRNLDLLVKKSTKGMIERILFMKPNPSRKVSIVVSDKELFEYLLEFKGNISYRGNLSIIYVDAEEVRIIREEYVSFYDMEEQKERLRIV